LKASNVSTPTLSLPRPTASAPSASTQRTAAPPTVARGSQPSAVFQSSFEASSQRTATSGSEVLPTSVNPPTDDRLNQGINNAYQQVFSGKKFPTGPERTELFKLAVKMRSEGASAGAIESAISSKLQAEVNAEADKANPSQQLEDAIKLVYRDGSQPSQADKNKFLKVAQDLAKEGKGATDIKWTLYAQMSAAKEGLDNTGPAVQKKMFVEAYKQFHGHTATPSAADETKWMKEAAKLAQEGKSPTDIKWTLYAMIRDATQGPTAQGPATRDEAFKEAFANVYGGTPSAAEQTKWMNKAKEMADKGASNYDIKWALIGEMNLAKSGMDNTRPETLKRLVNESLKIATGGTPSPAEEAKWLAVADKMAKEGKSATDIKWGVYGEIRNAQEGVQGDPKSPTVLNNMVAEAFKQVMQNNGRQLSGRELSEWMKVATKLAEQGQDAFSIKWSLVGQMSEALTNR